MVIGQQQVWMDTPWNAWRAEAESSMDDQAEVQFCCPAPAGGAVAYQRKGSQASLVAGGTVAGALLLAASLMQGRTRVPATLLALGALPSSAFPSRHACVSARRWSCACFRRTATLCQLSVLHHALGWLGLLSSLLLQRASHSCVGLALALSLATAV